jgi:hypothetical protein
VVALPLLSLLTLSVSAAKLVTLNVGDTFPSAGQTVVKEMGTIDAGMDFNEAIVSWNVENPEAAGLSVRVKAIQSGVETKEFDLGDWTYDVGLRPRVSVNGQADATGTVLTDTLHLKTLAQKLELRILLTTLKPGPVPKLKLLTVCFSNTSVTPSDDSLPSKAWGTDIAVPERAQDNYPNGGVLCSATSVSMLLSHYSRQLHRPELDQDVPAVQAGVWDSVYKGAGNWPFNTASIALQTWRSGSKSARP